MAINTTVAYAYATQTVADTALALSEFTDFAEVDMALATRIRLTVNTNAIRYRFDGGDPTTTAGHYLATNGTIPIDGSENVANFRIIRDGGSSASVSVTLEQ
jgi:hypothetical protein